MQSGLVNKDDLMQKGDWERIQELLSELEREILQKHGRSVGRISFRRIVARAEEGVESRGIPEIFRGWVEESANLPTNTVPSEFNSVVSSPREFDRFALVQMPGEFAESPE